MSARRRRDPEPAPAEVEVRAAGGVVVRAGAEGPEIALVHRPRYDDWSLPKGKLAPGEAWESAALREVVEETGLRCKLGEELGSTRYADRKGREKLVRYWRMRPEGGDFAPSHEVDELRWVAPDEAVDMLDYEHDRRLVREVAARLGDASDPGTESESEEARR